MNAAERGNGTLIYALIQRCIFLIGILVYMTFVMSKRLLWGETPTFPFGGRIATVKGQYA